MRKATNEYLVIIGQLMENKRALIYSSPIRNGLRTDNHLEILEVAIAYGLNRSIFSTYHNALNNGILTTAGGKHRNIIQHYAQTGIVRNFKRNLIRCTLYARWKHQHFSGPCSNIRRVGCKQLPRSRCVHAIIHAERVKEPRASYLSMRKSDLRDVLLGEIHCRRNQARTGIAYLTG